jgi:hypothetical protein
MSRHLIHAKLNLSMPLINLIRTLHLSLISPRLEKTEPRLVIGMELFVEVGVETLELIISYPSTIRKWTFHPFDELLMWLFCVQRY